MKRSLRSLHTEVRNDLVTTIFLQLTKEQYFELIENLAVAHMTSAKIIEREKDEDCKAGMIEENNKLEELMHALGEQGQSQL